MKIKSLLVAVLLMGGVLVAPAQAADGNFEIPVVQSFTVSDKSIETTSGLKTVTFELKVLHSVGIKSISTLVHLINSERTFTFNVPIFRTDNPIQQNLKNVTFTGKFTFPDFIPSGLYTFYADPIEGLPAQRNQQTPATQIITPDNFNEFVGGEKAIQVRTNGALNLTKLTFVGPIYDSEKYLRDETPQTKFSTSPIFKIGEAYDPTKYFELRISGVSLQIKSTTSDTCVVKENILNFIGLGVCRFTVFTPKNLNYVETSISLSGEIGRARIKPTIAPEKIQNQVVDQLPMILKLNQTYNSSSVEVFPKTETPGTCYMTGTYWINLIGRGTCTLSYMSPEDDSYKQTETYRQSFEILNADGSKFSNPTPTKVVTLAPTPTMKPVVKKTISCVKGTKTIKKTAVSPKCPAGYKLKK
jgi:hypothetical protein